MKISGNPRTTIWEIQDGIEVIDQRLLPHKFATVKIYTYEQAIEAIKNMTVRGAPLIGAVGAYAVYLMFKQGDGCIENADKIIKSRPTAVNLSWAVERVMNSCCGMSDCVDAALVSARQVVIDELDRSKKIGLAGMEIIRDLSNSRANNKSVNILTHCNAGWLACIDYGTALAPIYAAHDHKIPIHVWVDETRPRNQGSSLTAYELGEEGVPYTVIADNAGGFFMQTGQVDAVIVGADRVASNGDTANKIGTYLKALAARELGIPFYVAMPSSTIDRKIKTGDDIVIEERSADEVRYAFGLDTVRNIQTSVLLTPPHAQVANPAFDVTPGHLITGFITERGILSTNQL